MGSSSGRDTAKSFAPLKTRIGCASCFAGRRPEACSSRPERAARSLREPVPHFLERNRTGEPIRPGLDYEVSTGGSAFTASATSLSASADCTHRTAPSARLPAFSRAMSKSTKSGSSDYRAAVPRHPPGPPRRPAFQPPLMTASAREVRHPAGYAVASLYRIESMLKAAQRHQ